MILSKVPDPDRTSEEPNHDSLSKDLTLPSDWIVGYNDFEFFLRKSRFQLEMHANLILRHIYKIPVRFSIF
jgi:hypothetical protein